MENRGNGKKGSATEAENDVLFEKLKNGEEGVSIQQILDMLDENGLSKKSPRLKKILGPYLQKDPEEKLNKSEFSDLLTDPNSALIKHALTGKLIIRDFLDFKKDIEAIFEETKAHTGGEMNDMLPHPAPERQPAYAVSVCTVDGQLLQLGDYDLGFLLQSIAKPVIYAIAVEELGKEKVHEHVGSEPGDESFDTGQILNEKDLPHNPMLTSGSIMASSLIKPDMEVGERLKEVMEVWKKMTGDKEVNYNDESFNIEIKNANKHYALAHLMKQRGAFPEDVDLENSINFYLKCNALEMNVDNLAHAAATFANFGTCPSTGKRVFNHDTVRNTLSLMLTSGMYDHSGEFAFRVGLPAKSGVAGGMMVVIPELMGIAVYSPPLDSHGNSIKGVGFCEKLVDMFNFHLYDAVRTSIHGKKDPRLKKK